MTRYPCSSFGNEVLCQSLSGSVAFRPSLDPPNVRNAGTREGSSPVQAGQPSIPDMA